MDYEVVIVGAGPAGIFAALTLADLGIKPVLLLEKRYSSFIPMKAWLHHRNILWLSYLTQNFRLLWMLTLEGPQKWKVSSYNLQFLRSTHYGKKSTLLDTESPPLDIVDLPPLFKRQSRWCPLTSEAFCCSFNFRFSFHLRQGGW